MPNLVIIYVGISTQQPTYIIVSYFQIVAMQRTNNLLPNNSKSNSKTKTKSVKFELKNQFDLLASEFDSDEPITPQVVDSLKPSVETETSTSTVEYQIDLELGINSPESAFESGNCFDDLEKCISNYNNSIADFANTTPEFFDDGDHDRPLIWDTIPDQYAFSSTRQQSAFAFPASHQQSVNFADDFNGESTPASEYPRSRQYTNNQFEYLEKLEESSSDLNTDEDGEFEKLIIYDSISRIHDSIVNPQRKNSLRAGLDLDELAFFDLLLNSAGESTPRIEDEISVDAPLTRETIPPTFKDTDNSKTRGVIESVVRNFAFLYTIDSFETPTTLRVRLPEASELEGFSGREDFSIYLACRNPKTIKTIHDWVTINYPNTMRDNTMKLTVLENRIDFSLRPKPPVVPASEIEGSFVHALVNGAPEPASKIGGGASEPALKTGGGSSEPASNTGGGASKTTKAEKTSSAPKASKVVRPVPPRCASWPTVETIIQDLATAVPHAEGLVASATYTLEEGTPEEFASWCMSATGKKSIEITAKKDGKRRVRIFAGDKAGHVKKAYTGGGGASSKGGKP